MVASRPLKSRPAIGYSTADFHLGDDELIGDDSNERKAVGYWIADWTLSAIPNSASH